MPGTVEMARVTLQRAPALYVPVGPAGREGDGQDHPGDAGTHRWNGENLRPIIRNSSTFPKEGRAPERVNIGTAD